MVLVNSSSLAVSWAIVAVNSGAGEDWKRTWSICSAILSCFFWEILGMVVR